MKVFLVSLGCDKNRVDSERMLGLLTAAGFSYTDDEYEADIIIVNTCCFIDDAKTESIDTILELAQCKEDGNCRYLFVTGCLAERYREEILVQFPEVDGYIGTKDLTEILSLIRSHIEDDTAVNSCQVQDTAASLQHRVISTPGHYEFLKIAEGCNKRCTYCIIPYIRGSYSSFPVEQLVSEAEELAAQGVTELILVAQETSIYGKDLYGKEMLPSLLESLCRIEALRWIRVLYCYPEDITDAFLAVMAKEPKICKYIDMPVQHASDRILKRMGRRCTHAHLTDIIAKVRDRVPGVVLRTSLITGFPGETEEDHQILLDFVKQMRFERLGVFTYSREEGTPAFSFEDQIDDEVKNQRRDDLMSAQELISYENLAGHIGETFDVVIDGYLPDDDVYVGRTYMDAPDVDGAFFFRADRNYMTGDHVNCIVTNVSDYDLYGEPVSG